MKVPEYIERRIRSPIPKGCKVVPDSTPVVAFGDPTKAKIATLGINPSKQEFLDQEGNEIKYSKRRFETLGSLDLPSMTEASDSAVAQVFEPNRWGLVPDLERWGPALPTPLGLEVGGVGRGQHRGRQHRCERDGAYRSYHVGP